MASESFDRVRESRAGALPIGNDGSDSSQKLEDGEAGAGLVEPDFERAGGRSYVKII